MKIGPIKASFGKDGKIEIPESEVEDSVFWSLSAEDIVADIVTDLKYALRKVLPHDADGEPVLNVEAPQLKVTA
jgi:hypothetical protein